ncbi:uncharacterized protein LOC109538379 [Dendroctonus ponderosae]|uniref:Uncharacterized protein n=2 Tax=Dendroctonus ponderosae TaxID=77166 RepID=A0AAR5PJE0_DENPD|nr:uncharacterized protein LOC109538379 [Dendroctonus ponderosae]XP_019761155.1 uncharacterized protein LOC109538379 [Dendroctonus ponderosae]KAH1015818.1 hypothetical protein HUJ04_007143 [Dendroctonus ponderosae]KAH1025091.1 hypothetical protein HUJ05_009888 [Dendroctonus ponderosae]
MHFWINKGNQQGHYWPRSCRLVRPPPEAVANYLARHPRGFYPKPMVTPVRRFQSLESVSNNGLRYNRSSPGHRPNRQATSNAHVVYYNTSPNVRIEREISVDVDHEETNAQNLENIELELYIHKFKLALLGFAFLAICVLFGANYLSTGQLWRLGVETLVVISVLLIVLLLGAIIIMYLDERHNANVAIANQQNAERRSIQLETEYAEEQEPQRPTQLSIDDSGMREMSPPPYHIAIRLTNQTELEEIQIYNDQSPPPPYEKAVT